mmetsp:Transcript_133017/g.284330  ORF Transcript_133017/g.284330 Transcript_133017/m.284330 type:complete len:785 (+) Transcript_133017:73-2427(+)
MALAQHEEEEEQEEEEEDGGINSGGERDSAGNGKEGFIDPTAAAAATLELMGAVAMARERRHRNKPRPRYGVGRAGRAERARCAAALSAATVASPPPVETERISMAREDLLSAKAGEEQQRQERRLRDESFLLGLYATKLQNCFRKRQAKRRLDALRAERARRLLEEQRRLWTELRKPRPVRLVQAFEKERRAHEAMIIAEAEKAAREAAAQAQKASILLSPSEGGMGRLNLFRRQQGGESTGEEDDETRNQSDAEVNSRQGSKEEIRALRRESTDDWDAIEAESKAQRDSLAAQSNSPRAVTPRSVASSPPTSPVRAAAFSGQGPQLSPYQLAMMRKLADEADEKQRREEAEREEKAAADKAAARERRKRNRQRPENPVCVKMSFAEKAAASLRDLLLTKAREREERLRREAREAKDYAEGFSHKAAPSKAGEREEMRRLVHDAYLRNCELWQTKPNSKALLCIDGATTSPGQDGEAAVTYDFGDAYLGDRGVVSALHAIAWDTSCRTLSLRACGLRHLSAPAVAAFLELHPKLSHVDLSQNSFSFEAGELIVDALTRRSRDNSLTSEPGGPAPLVVKSKTSPAKLALLPDLPRLKGVTVDIGGTWLSWDRGGPTSGTPCGTYWAGHGDMRSCFAPSGYERLRGKLDRTKRVQYTDARSRTPSPDKGQGQTGEARRTPSKKGPPKAASAPLGAQAGRASLKGAQKALGREAQDRLDAADVVLLAQAQPEAACRGAEKGHIEAEAASSLQAPQQLPCALPEVADGGLLPNLAAGGEPQEKAGSD